ncbi:alpha/beta hydrolase [Isoptericola sp. NEAU-Y5]|uniref:Alpha/beta hydrolase n=1 Tax=Isoptericola luteus TaxID=2879484 RepID=A0ABS7ZI17_9MICO|nr:alpha/beta hydrolase [Isoptericola sp. NEAU-Y5]MCA5894675.1 alpha/beta hydrolase [Isoptericola sp. NEAU-Y5]
MSSSAPPAGPPAGLAWADDPLLPGFAEQAPLGPATLVRPLRRPPDRPHPPERPRAAVLHVHGYNDYFFQRHLADAFGDAGHAFYAVDLRRAGRSLARRSADDPTPPHFMTTLREPGEDLTAAARAVRALEPGLPLVVHAHSTGGLTAALWSFAVRQDATARPDLLVLNSPFLDLHGPWLQRAARTSVVEVLGRRRPLAVVSASPSMYATYQHVSSGGRWDFDTELKRPAGLPARAAWLRAVRHAQLRVARGLGIGCPVLVARSARSGPDSPANPSLDAQDTVLDVARIATLSRRLGADVTELVVPDGVHDLTLSASGPRAVYLESALGWVAERLPVPGRTEDA